MILEKVDCAESLDSGSFLRGAIDALPHQIAVLDHDGVVIAVNESWKRFARENGASSRAAFVGADYLHNCRAAAETDIYALRTLVGLGDILAGERDQFSIEYPCRAPGNERWFLMHAARVNQPPAAVVVSHTEITDRKRMEEALRRGQEDFALAQQVGQIGWWRLETKKNELTWSDETRRIFDAEKAAPLTYDDFIAMVHPDDRAIVNGRWDAALNGEAYDVEHRIFADGRVKWVREKAYLEFDAAGAVASAFGIVQDITERKAAEAALRDADRRKDEFLATLAHELRNPLTPIRNAVHLLRLNSETPGRENRNPRLFEMVERQVSHLVRLVDDLLEVSRITRGKIELRKERLDLTALLRHVVDASQPAIQRGGHELRMDLPSEPLILDADPVRLSQIFTNLLDNAAKYTEAGGTITLTAARQGAAATISVRDNGVGIPAELLPRVFEIFTQVDRSLGRAQGGLGIGLALVRSLVEMHGGSVEADSAGLGRGSTFVVRLPLAAGGAADSETEDGALQGAMVSRRVLVIDDDRDVADSLAMFLETMGATVRAAYSGDAGLDALGEFDPELVFLDLGMPRMDGYETARRIRSRPEGRRLPLVALTGWGQDQVCARARAAGFDRHLTKPADLDALQNLLVSL